jgi:hypothetical protein
MAETHSAVLHCSWTAWRVIDDGILALDMPENNCCDMRGAIKIAEAIHPFVWKIETFEGGRPDIVYIKHPIKGWISDSRALMKKLSQEC